MGKQFKIFIFLAIFFVNFCFSQNITSQNEKKSWEYTYLALLADKAAELSWLDLCEISIFEQQGKNHFPEPINLIFSKQSAKGFGTMAKAAHMEEAGYAVALAYAAGYCGIQLSEILISSYDINFVGTIATGTFLLVKNAKADNIFSNDTTWGYEKKLYEEFESGIANPLLFKILQIGSAIAFEKKIENLLFSVASKEAISQIFTQYGLTYLSQNKIKKLENTVYAGTSKIGAALLVLLVSSIIDTDLNMDNLGKDILNTIQIKAFQGFAIPIILVFIPPVLVISSKLFVNWHKAFK